MRRHFAFLALGLSLFLAGCDQQLYTGLSAKDANEMTALLYRNNIAVSRIAAENSTYSLSVPQGELARAVNILDRYGYPKEQYRSVAEVFPGDGLIVSPFEQHARLTYATSQELTKTINSIDGVVSARVHVVMPELDLRSGAPSKASASIMIVHRPSIDTAELSSKIRLIVANAVQDLDYRNVSIAFFPSEGNLNAQLAADNGMASGNGEMNLANLMASPNATLMLWLMAAAAGVLSLVIFLRRLQSRT